MIFSCLKILLAVLFLSACADKGSVEKEINQILKKAASFDKRKMYKQAIEEYKKLQSYADSPAYVEMNVEKSVRDAGWDIENLEHSHTIKVMTDYQNRINLYFDKNKKMPDFSSKGWSAYDIWGQKIKYKERILVKHKGKFDYMLISKGVDGKADTADDLVLVNKIVKGGMITAPTKKEKLENILSEKKIIEKKPDKSQEYTVDLKEMIAKKRKEEEK